MGKKSKKAREKSGKSADGVKLPKALRKFGDKALELAKQPVVSEIAATALLAAAAALRDNKGLKASAKAAGDAGSKAAEEAGDAARNAGREAAKIGDALRTLALDLARRTLDQVEERVEKKSAAKAPAAKAAAGKAPAAKAPAAKAPAAKADKPKKAKAKAPAKG